jgi:hypothetical protein
MNNRWLWTGKPWQAFKTFAIFFSFAMNLIVLVVLLVAAPLIVPIIGEIAAPLVGGLNSSFEDMNDASIKRTIQVEDDLDIDFVQRLSTTTHVIVDESVALEGVPARFVLPDGGGAINGQVFLDLPEGLDLPVQLEIDVPVQQTIPVEVSVDVDIPLNETELGKPFGRLQSLFGPLNALIEGLPTSNDELMDRLAKARSGGEPTIETADAR